MSTNVQIIITVLLIVNILLTVYYKYYKENYDEYTRVDYDLTINHSEHSVDSDDSDEDEISNQ